METQREKLLTISKMENEFIEEFKKFYNDDRYSLTGKLNATIDILWRKTFLECPPWGNNLECPENDILFLDIKKKIRKLFL